MEGPPQRAFSAALSTWGQEIKTGCKVSDISKNLSQPMITLCPKCCCQKICNKVKTSQNQLHQRQVQDQSPSTRKTKSPIYKVALASCTSRFPLKAYFVANLPETPREWKNSKEQNVKILCLLVNKLSNVKSIETGLTCSRLARCQSFFQEWIQQHWTSVRVLGKSWNPIF